MYSCITNVNILTSLLISHGIKEAVMGFATGMMGNLFQSGVMVSLLQRVTLMIVYIVVGGLFAWPVFRKMKLADRQPEEIQ